MGKIEITSKTKKMKKENKSLARVEAMSWMERMKKYKCDPATTSYARCENGTKKITKKDPKKSLSISQIKKATASTTSISLTMATKAPNVSSTSLLTAATETKKIIEPRKIKKVTTPRMHGEVASWMNRLKNYESKMPLTDSIKETTVAIRSKPEIVPTVVAENLKKRHQNDIPILNPESLKTNKKETKKEMSTPLARMEASSWRNRLKKY